MKLSMSLLAWYLRDYHPDTSIQNDSLSISGIRFHQDETHPVRKEYVYFSQADIWFEDPKYTDTYLIAHGQSTLFFWNCDYDELLNSLLSAFDYFNSWESQLLEAASRYAPLQEMLEIGVQVLSNPVTIADFENTKLASVDAGRKREDLYWQLMSEKGIVHPATLHDHYYDIEGNPITDLSEEPKLVKNVFPGGSPVMMLYIKQGNERLGCFCILQEDPNLIEMNLQVSQFLVRYFVKAKEFTHPAGSVRSTGQIFRDVIDGMDVGKDNLARLENRLPPPPWRILLLRHETRKDLLATRNITTELNKHPHILFPVVRDEMIAALVEDIHWDTAAFAQSLYNYCVAASMPFYSLKSAVLGCKQAEFTMSQANYKAGLWNCENFAFNYLIENLKRMDMTGLLLHPALNQLHKYDADNQTELLHTLSEFLVNEMNQANTAQTLHIHSNTLKYRLRRIREITGLTLTDHNELKYLRLSDWIYQGK